MDNNERSINWPALIMSIFIPPVGYILYLSYKKKENRYMVDIVKGGMATGVCLWLQLFLLYY